MHDGSISSQGIAAATVPIVQSTLTDSSLQPSALVFRSGIAFDYDNFPKFLSVCWPVFNNESGMSLIARDGPERSLTQTPTNEIVTFNNDVPISGVPVFTWGPPQSEPVVKDPVMSTPEKKVPIGISIRNSCEIQTETITSNTAECVKSTFERQEEATTIPPVSQKGSCYEPAESTTLQKVGISGEKHCEESSFDKVQFNANKKRSDSEEARDLKRKGARTKPAQVTLCLPADDKRSGFKAQEMLGPVNHESEKSDHAYRCIQSKERPDASDCERDTMATSKESKIFSSSTETKRVEEDNSVCKATAEFSPLVVSSNLSGADVAPIVKEDNVVSAANKTDRSEESYVFCYSAPCQSSSGSNHSTVNLQQCSRLEAEDTQENVRDLIIRIRYIKSRLHRAESDYRKKRMLKTIVGLQKRVKALVKGMNKEKTDPGKEQQETRDHNEGLPGQELAGSQGRNTTDRELPTNHVITDQGDVSLLPEVQQTSKDSSKDTTRREYQDQQNCKELTVELPPVLIVNHNNDAASRETKTADDLKSKTFRHSKDGDMNCKSNNNRREDRGSLSLITSNGSVDKLSLRLPFGIGLDFSPCGKRAASSSDIVGLQKNHSTTAKKMKRLSLSDEGVKKIDARFADVTHHIQNVTQDGTLEGSELNERNEDTNNAKSEEANASRNDESDLLIRKEFSLSDTDDVTVLNSRDAAQKIGAMDNRGVPLNSIIGDDVQAEENNRTANEGTGKDRSVALDGIHNIDDAATVKCSDNKSDGDVQMDEIHKHNPYSEEMQDMTFNLTPVEDNPSEEEEKHCRSLLERVLQDEETQGFTSPAIYNPSGRQEDVDLTQSLQIREARILNLTRKRDRLLNLTGFKLE